MTDSPPLAGPVPANLRAFVEVLGDDLVIPFFLRFGGGPLYLSERPGGKGALEDLVGADRVRALAERFGKGHLYRVPINRPWLARRMKADGWSVLAIAREMHVTDVTVRSWLRGRDGRQLRLFDD